MRRARKVALLTGAATPAAVARHLLRYGERGLAAWICEDLGGPGRVRRFASLDDAAACEDVVALNVLLLARTDPAWRPPPALPFLRRTRSRWPTALRPRDEARVQVLALAALALRPDAVVWDVGAGSGSVAIEAASLAPERRVFAIERDAESAAHCRANALRHGMDHVTVVEGAAPAVLDGLAPRTRSSWGAAGARARPSPRPRSPGSARRPHRDRRGDARDARGRAPRALGRRDRAGGDGDLGRARRAARRAHAARAALAGVPRGREHARGGGVSATLYGVGVGPGAPTSSPCAPSRCCAGRRWWPRPDPPTAARRSRSASRARRRARCQGRRRSRSPSR